VNELAFMMVFGSCVNCGVFMGFNPEKVPSIRVNGIREPLCKKCFIKWNEIHRISKGLEPMKISPEAYFPSRISPNVADID